VLDGVEIANSTDALRVLETAGPPVYYVPPANVRLDLMTPSPHETHCEWKGEASYYSLRVGDRVVSNVAWTYHEPLPGFEQIRDHVAFYAGLVDEAWVGDEQATPQPGRFYGGWVTSKIVGPFKGEPGTSGW
jgi:uncharacterized protein (DUF427 family)